MTLTNQTTAKKIIMRRLFKQDLNAITECYKKYDKLFYNPISDEFLKNVMLCGEIWGAFKDDNLISCCYFFPLESQFFQNQNTFSLLTDFIAQPSQYVYMGYVGTNFDSMSDDEKQFFTEELDKCHGLYTAFLNIVEMQTFRRGLKYILHSVPVKMRCGLSPLFAADYKMIKLRGLDNLVVHYIFAKSVFPNEGIYLIDEDTSAVNVNLSETKTVSALLENGYCCVNLIKEQNDDTLVCYRLVTD